jgi:hypothetical protein
MAIGVIALVHLSVSSALAAFGEDVEKPKPEFTQEGPVITAKLLPRGKSNKIAISFEAKGGELTAVKAMDFPAGKSAEVNHKDFRSDLFAISVSNVAKGGDITLTVRSDYFNSSTRFFAFNEKGNPVWNDAQAQYKQNEGKIRDLIMTVKDGGNLDADGAADGKILVNGGPKDSFWGYAIGTLFIRFFGVFLVLGVLQIGMMICGKIFESAGKRKSELDEQALAQIPPVKSTTKRKINSEMVAAISIALHMALASGEALCGKIPEPVADIDPDIVAAVSMVLHLERQEMKS